MEERHSRNEPHMVIAAWMCSSCGGSMLALESIPRERGGKKVSSNVVSFMRSADVIIAGI